ncbi:MAG TPA: SH3 domain-containing protein [Fibrobacteria bacterium]|nr:SH3 domain-containing protein [Fibrobacteria bacterium]
MIRNKTFLALSILSLVAVVGCKKSKNAPGLDSTGVADSATSAAAEDPFRILVTARTAIYPQAKDSGKSLALLQPGETVTFLEDSSENPGKKEWFYKIRLSDGTEGWARNYGMMLGKPAVSLVAQAFYQRPDFMSTKAGELSVAQLLVIQGTQEEFVKVAPSRWKSGWVRLADISTDKDEIVAAALASRDLGKNPMDTVALRKALGNISSSTKVHQVLKARLDSLVGGDATETARGSSEEVSEQDAPEPSQGE